MSNPVKLAPRMDVDGNAQAEFDSASQETITRFSAVVFDEDFTGPSHTATLPTTAQIGYPWVNKSATGTVVAVANAPGGVIAIAISATTGAQEGALTSGDARNWDVTKYASFETRLALSVVPTGIAEALWGLRANYVSPPDSVTTYLDFQVVGNGNVNVRVKDGVTGGASNVQTYATGVTLAAGVFHNFRIDVSDPTNVVFYIDGARVSPAPPATKLVFAGTGASAVLQPYFSVYKASGTDVGTMQVDAVQIGMNRS